MTVPGNNQVDELFSDSPDKTPDGSQPASAHASQPASDVESDNESRKSEKSNSSHASQQEARYQNAMHATAIRRNTAESLLSAFESEDGRDQTALDRIFGEALPSGLVLCD